MSPFASPPQSHEGDITVSRARLTWVVALIATNLFAVAQIFAGPRAAGSWVGVQNALGNVSGIVGPIITGLIVDYLGGYTYAFATAAALAALGALLWWVLIPEIRTLDI